MNKMKSCVGGVLESEEEEEEGKTFLSSFLEEVAERILVRFVYVFVVYVCVCARTVALKMDLLSGIPKYIFRKKIGNDAILFCWKGA